VWHASWVEEQPDEHAEFVVAFSVSVPKGDAPPLPDDADADAVAGVGMKQPV